MTEKGKKGFYFNKAWRDVPKCIEYVAGRSITIINGFAYEENDLRQGILNVLGFDEVVDIRSIRWKLRKELIKEFHNFVGKAA